MARTFDLRGKTALVTGASSGIGREIARVLARDVAVLVLVARRKDRLDELAQELTSKRPALRVIVREVDLTDREATASTLDALEKQEIAIDVLVNNAGFGDRGLLNERPWSKIEALLDLNVVTLTYLVHRLVPPMIARGSGAVMLVGSIAGIVAKPGSAVYGSSKSYVNALGEALHAELASTGVVVTTVLPGPVPTEFGVLAAKMDATPFTPGASVPHEPPQPGRFKLPGTFVVSAERCAEEAVRALVRGEARVVTGAAVKAMASVMDNLPRPILRLVLARAATKLRR